jgi:predicted permease
MTTIWQDVRYSLRLLARQPGFTLVAILTLALGVGASTAIFSVIDAAILHPLPYPHPEQLVSVWIEQVDPTGERSRYGPSLADLRRWQDAGVFASIAAWRHAFLGRVVDGPEPERVNVREVSEHYLNLHGVAPVLGRDFTAEDSRPGAPAVVLLGEGYWQSHLHGDPGVLGRTIRFDDGPATIVGVVPGWFYREDPMWRALQVAPSADRRGSGRETDARLRPELTLQETERRLSTMVDMASAPGTAPGAARVVLRSRIDSQIGDYRKTVNILSGAVALILLLACVNAAGLLLARGTARQPELAVRASLGAGRWRLIRQLLTESVVLSVAGGAVGIFIAWLSLDTLVANVPMSLPPNSPARLNLAVLAASAALTIATGTLFGLAPAFRLSRIHLGAALARGPRQSSALTKRGGQILIAAEVALAVVLVSAAALMIRSFARVTSVDIGFDPRSIVTMKVTPLDLPPAGQRQYYLDLLRVLRALPGITAAGAVDHLPLGGSASVTYANVSGVNHSVGRRSVLPGYFEAMGLPVREGRLPDDADYAAGSPAVAINSTAALALFPSGSALGRTFTGGRSAKVWQVGAVVGDVRHGGPLWPPDPEVYLPFEATGDANAQALALTIVVRPGRATASLPDELRRTAQSLGPRVLIEDLRPGGDWLARNVVTPKRRTVLLGLLGGLGLILALVAVFGMTAYAVTRRTREIGVRIALGARAGQVVGTMVRDSALPIVIGTVAGLGGAAAATRVIASFLFQMSPTDPATFAIVAVTLLVTGCLAAWVPARRAARVDPVTALRAG